MVSSIQALSQEAVWFEKYRCEDAERQFHEITYGKLSQATTPSSSLADEIAQARQHILSSLQAISSAPSADASADLTELTNQLRGLQQENQTLRKVTDELRALVLSLDARVKFLETGDKPKSEAPAAAQAPAKEAPAAAGEDDDVDLFASDDEEDNAEADRIKEERLAAYAAKKAKKPVLIAKSNIILDVKPWDDETDMKAMEEVVRKIECDGLLWGASKLVPLAYGIKKLQISCVVEDDKVSIDWLTETIQENEDLVQSVDIAAFNKI